MHTSGQGSLQLQNCPATNHHLKVQWRMPCDDEWLTFVCLSKVMNQEVLVQLVNKQKARVGMIFAATPSCDSRG